MIPPEDSTTARHSTVGRREMRQCTIQIQARVAAAANRKISRLNSGLKPGAILKAFFAICAGQPVCLASQPSQMKTAQVDSIMTENQSTALMAPRFMVGRPK